jgi:hypothetical protein
MTPRQKRRIAEERAWTWAGFLTRWLCREPFYRPWGRRASGPEVLAVRLLRFARRPEKE